MKNAQLAHRYAQAFIANIKTENYPDLANDLVILQALFSESQSFSDILQSLIVPERKKRELIDLVAKDLKHSRLWQNLFILVMKKHRVNVLSKIITQIEGLLLEKQNKSILHLVLAREHNDETKNKIVDYIRDRVGRDLILKTKIDPSIIGGFIATVESERFDGSVSHNLEQFEKRTHT